MATISITIKDSQLTRTVDAICGSFGYNGTLEDGTDNPETKAQFAKRMLASYIKSTVLDYESKLATEQAVKQAMIVEGQVESLQVS
jgi:hypothetical protein